MAKLLYFFNFFNAIYFYLSVIYKKKQQDDLLERRWKYHIIRLCENVCVKTQSYRSVTFSSNEIKARVVYSGYFRKV